MFLRTREIALTGLAMAMGVVLILLGGALGTSTLFFLAAAAFLAGILERNCSLGIGGLYLAGTGLLGFFLSPRKLQLVTFLFMGIYVLAAEWFEKREREDRKLPALAVWGVKFLLYHGMLAAGIAMLGGIGGIPWSPSAGVLGKVLKESRALWGLAALAGAEALWLLFDRAYLFFQRMYGSRFSLDGRD